MGATTVLSFFLFPIIIIPEAIQSLNGWKETVIETCFGMLPHDTGEIGSLLGSLSLFA